MRLHLLPATLVFVLSSIAGSQAAVVVPNGQDNITSSKNSNSPFGNGSSSAFTLQIDYAASQLAGIPLGSSINGIGFRLYSNSGTNTQALNYGSFNVQVGSAANSISTLSRTFANNQGADTILARSGALTIPARAFIGNKRINPFYTISFTIPYVYEGGDLLVTIADTVATDTQGTFVSLDAVPTGAAIGDVGLGSAGPNGTVNFFYAPVTQLDFAIAPVPGPSSWAIAPAALCLAGAIYSRRRGVPPLIS